MILVIDNNKNFIGTQWERVSIPLITDHYIPTYCGSFIRGIQSCHVNTILCSKFELEKLTSLGHPVGYNTHGKFRATCLKSLQCCVADFNLKGHGGTKITTDTSIFTKHKTIETP